MSDFLTLPAPHPPSERKHWRTWAQIEAEDLTLCYDCTAQVSAQAFREAAAEERESGDLGDGYYRDAAAAYYERERLLLAAAEQCEAHDRMMTTTAERLGHYEATIDTLTAELEASRRQVAELIARIDKEGTEV